MSLAQWKKQFQGLSPSEKFYKMREERQKRTIDFQIPGSIYRHISPKNAETIYNILGLSKAERKIIDFTWSYGKPLSLIAEATQIPKGSLFYMLQNLEKRKLIKSIRLDMHGFKRTSWKSNVSLSVLTMKRMLY